ncbi:hypothetical protein RHMOL_Rhmol03G0232500 [Rhododendron molle]|uniref:Uncharacterized protein n=1 Tax=Rhododendron molle TaxID=49168 RepID=A0ACC0PHM3_RHOML|nr:hypothetical protein RHMOL_Rhmol03G0232500 [Rhododendron molle]
MYFPPLPVLSPHTRSGERGNKEQPTSSSSIHIEGKYINGQGFHPLFHNNPDILLTIRDHDQHLVGWGHPRSGCLGTIAECHANGDGEINLDSDPLHIPFSLSLFLRPSVFQIESNRSKSIAIKKFKQSKAAMASPPPPSVKSWSLSVKYLNS